MSRTSTLILLGVLEILTPFSGIPVAFRTLFAVVFGAAIAAIGLSIRAQEAQLHKLPSESVPAIQSVPESEERTAPSEMSPV